MALTNKVSILAAIETYRQKNPRILNSPNDRDNLTPYERRKRSETARDLLRRDVIGQKKNGYSLVPLDMEADRSLAKTRLVIPTRIDYRALSYASLKLLLACYSLTRYSRTPFRLEMTHSEFAKKAQITEKSVRAGIKQLLALRLAGAKKVWRTGSRIELCDPESGVELYYIGDFYRRRMQKIPVFERYQYVLEDRDPRNQLRNMRGPAAKHQVDCPFCYKAGRSRSFTFECNELEGLDRWYCYKCKRSGDSARLWARFAIWVGRDKWRDTLPATMREPTERDGSIKNEVRGDTELSALKMLSDLESVKTADQHGSFQGEHRMTAADLFTTSSCGEQALLGQPLRGPQAEPNAGGMCNVDTTSRLIDSE